VNDRVVLEAVKLLGPTLQSLRLCNALPQRYAATGNPEGHGALLIGIESRLDRRGIVALLGAAPLLSELTCDFDTEMSGTGAARIASALEILRNISPFAALRVRCACLRNSNFGARALEPTDEVDLPSLLAACAAHASLRELVPHDIRFDATPALDALVDTAICGRWEGLRLTNAHVSAASLPSLIRLLRAGWLTRLSISGAAAEMFDGPAVPDFCAAVRTSRLVELELCGVSRWSTQAESTAFLEALAGHATLRKLSLSSNAVDDHPVARDEMGALMATLLSTESALRELDVSACALADEGILQLAVGLAASTQLQSLRCEDNDASLAAALQLAQAAEACTSLTQLNCDFEEDADPEMVRCLDLVWERAEQQQQQQQS
jgi:hypothetical protein